MFQDILAVELKLIPMEILLQEPSTIGSTIATFVAFSLLTLVLFLYLWCIGWRENTVRVLKEEFQETMCFGSSESKHFLLHIP